MVSSARPAPAEGKSSWLAIAALVLAILAFEAWLVLAGRSPGKIPGSLSDSSILALHAGQSGTFRPGRMDEGSVIACENDGLRIAAAVPAQGKFVQQHLEAPLSNTKVTLKIAHRSDDSVRIICSN